MPNESPNAQPSAILRARIIVAQDRPLLWQALADHFTANEDVELVVDRRRGERRRCVQTHELNRRTADRRRRGVEHDVHRREYVIVRAQQGHSGVDALGSTDRSGSNRVVWWQHRPS